MNPYYLTATSGCFKIGSLFFLIMSLCLNAAAQESNFLNIKAGMENIGHRDKGMSPLRYAGYGFLAEISWDKQSRTRSRHLALHYSSGFQRNKFDNPIDYKRGGFQVFQFYHQRKSAAKSILWGWSINNVFSHRYNAAFVNFNDHYEYFSNLGPAAKYLYPFQIRGRNLALEGVAYLQLLGVMIRPSYTSSYPVGFLREQESIVKGLLHSAKISHPGNSWNFGFKPRLIYSLNSGNSLSLGYHYEFYKLNSANAITQSNGIWSISLSTRL